MAEDIKHKLIQDLIKLAEDLGRTPLYTEFKNAGPGIQYKVEKHYGKYANLLSAAGMTGITDRLEPGQEEKLLKKFIKLCSKREQIQGFFRSTLDLSELFRRAGNPEVLKVVFQPDTHEKYKDPIAVNCYTEFLKVYKPHVQGILGDFVDCEGISHWPSESLEPRRLIPEIKRARESLAELVAATPSASTRIFICGNHEDWIRQALNQMPELFDGLADLGFEITVEKLLGLEQFGFDFFPLNELVQIGKAHFTHGIYAGNAHAKKHLDVFQANIYYGHLHDTQSYNKTSMDGPIEAASLGCLCRLDAKFLKGKPNNWVHAFGVFEFMRDGTYTRYIPNIINGKLAFNGQLFDGNKK